MSTTLTVTEARSKLLQLTKELSNDQTVTVTKRGKPVLAIIPWELYDSITETLEIMGDAELMASLRQSLQEAGKGKTIPWKKVKRGLGF